MKFKRSKCPIANSLEILGDKWTLLVIRDLFLGKNRYGEFISSPEQIPTNILADRLKRLEAGNLIEKRAYQDNPIRFEYEFTEKGRNLGPMLKELRDWGLNHIKGTQAFKKSQNKK